MHRAVLVRLLPAATVVLCVSTMSIPGWARSPRRQATVAAIEAPQRIGRSDPEGRGGAQRWDILITRADDHVLEGHVTRVGSAALQGGQLRGTIAGQHITGNVTDSTGGLITTFVGTITRGGGIRGTYHDHNGDAGHWSWEGPLPR